MKSASTRKPSLSRRSALVVLPWSFLRTVMPLKEQCATVEKDKAMRMKMRADEIAAVSEAVGILNDDDALDVFKKSLPSAALVQQPKKTYDALLQLASQKGIHIKATHRHRQMLLRRIGLLSVDQKTKRAGEEPKAEEPMSAADAGQGAEKLVTHMIDGMVGVLHDEDVGDEHKKAWCANETEVMHGVESEKKELIEKTTSEIAEQEDLLATTVAEIKSLTASIAALDKLVHETTE